MKRVFLLFMAVLLVFSVAGCVTPGDQEEYEIAFVTDIGQLMDKSFNQGTWEGVKQFAEANDKTYKYYQPAGESTDDDRYNAMAAAVRNGAKIIVCAGFMQATALEKAAKEFTDVKFVFVDGWAMGLANVTAIIFQEEQAGYFAGYAAVKEGYTKLGFTGGGGGTNPACQRFGYGYIQGASAAAVELGIEVSMKYSWLYGDSFAASTELQTMLEGWYSGGTEVVFACGGSMCTSAFAAASANNGKVIGVDVDQSAESPTVITSAMKGLTEGTMYALEKFYAGEWADISDKAANLGVTSNAVGLPTAEGSWRFANYTVAEYEALYAKLVANEIVVDTNVDGAEERTYANLTLEYIK